MVGMIALRGFLAGLPLGIDGAASAELGSLQVTRENFLAGLKDVEPSATREFFIEKSETTFASLGGLDEVKRMLDAVVEHSHLPCGDLREVWTGAAARHPACRPFGNGEDGDGAGALRRKNSSR